MRKTYVVKKMEKPEFLTFSECGPVFAPIAEMRYLYRFADYDSAVEFMIRNFMGIHFTVLPDYYIP